MLGIGKLLPGRWNALHGDEVARRHCPINVCLVLVRTTEAYSFPSGTGVTTIAAQLLDWLGPTFGPQLLSATYLLRTPILGMAQAP
jgi:hypothetical protein